jgi:hypothetical protein
MSRPTYQPKHSYTGNGTLDQYTFDFKIELAIHLLIVVLDENGDEIERVRGDDTSYLSSVTFNSIDGGGTVFLNDVLPVNHKLYILLASDSPTQSFEFRNKTSFTLRRFEDALDWVQGQIQRISYRAKQALKIHDSENEESFGSMLPPGISDQGGSVLQVSQDATKFQFGPKFPVLIKGRVPVVNNDETGFDWYTLTENTELSTDIYKGFSQRFNENWDTVGTVDTLNAILDFGYSVPLVSLDCSASDDDTLREKGTVITATTLNATITKRSDPIARIVFKFNGGVIADFNPPSNTDSHTESYAWVGSFSDNATFTVEVDDDGTTGGPTTVVASSSFSFVYPYYYGVGAVGLSAAQVALLTKEIVGSSANKNVVFNIAIGQVYYFAYPAAYGALTSILDENGFETIGDWTLSTSNITGLDASAQSYRIYRFNNPAGGAITTNYTFNR